MKAETREHPPVAFDQSTHLGCWQSWITNDHHQLKARLLLAEKRIQELEGRLNLEARNSAGLTRRLEYVEAHLGLAVTACRFSGRENRVAELGGVQLKDTDDEA